MTTSQHFTATPPTLVYLLCCPRMSLVHVDLNATIGAFQIGSIISVFLFGIITLQAHLYYTSFQEDRWSFKVLVRLYSAGYQLLLKLTCTKVGVIWYGRHLLDGLETLITI